MGCTRQREWGLARSPERGRKVPFCIATTAEHSLTLHRRQYELILLGLPLLVGWSRKQTLGTITGRPVHERAAASVAAALASAVNGASLVRVHDVAATVDALQVWQAFGMTFGINQPLTGARPIP